MIIFFSRIQQTFEENVYCSTILLKTNNAKQSVIKDTLIFFLHSKEVKNRQDQEACHIMECSL